MKTFSKALFLTLVLTAAAAHAQTSVALPNPLGGVSTIGDLLNKIIDALILFASPVVVVIVMYAGYLFLSARDEPEKITQARNTILYAMLGYGIILIAKGIGLIIQSFFS